MAGATACSSSPTFPTFFLLQPNSFYHIHNRNRSTVLTKMFHVSKLNRWRADQCIWFETFIQCLLDALGVLYSRFSYISSIYTTWQGTFATLHRLERPKTKNASAEATKTECVCSYVVVLNITQGEVSDISAEYYYLSQACKEVMHAALMLEVQSLRKQRSELLQLDPVHPKSELLSGSRSTASLSHILAEAMEESSLWTSPWKKEAAFPSTFLGRLTGELVRLSDPLVAVYDSVQCAWMARTQPGECPTTSASLLAEISVRSPWKLSIYIIFKKNLDQSIQKKMYLILKTEALSTTCFHNHRNSEDILFGLYWLNCLGQKTGVCSGTQGSGQSAGGTNEILKELFAYL